MIPHFSPFERQCQPDGSLKSLIDSPEAFGRTFHKSSEASCFGALESSLARRGCRLQRSVPNVAHHAREYDWDSRTVLL